MKTRQEWKKYFEEKITEEQYLAEVRCKTPEANPLSFRDEIERRQRIRAFTETFVLPNWTKQ